MVMAINLKANRVGRVRPSVTMGGKKRCILFLFLWFARLRLMSLLLKARQKLLVKTAFSYEPGSVINNLIHLQQ